MDKGFVVHAHEESVVCTDDGSVVCVAVGIVVHTDQETVVCTGQGTVVGTDGGTVVHARNGSFAEHSCCG